MIDDTQAKLEALAVLAGVRHQDALTRNVRDFANRWPSATTEEDRRALRVEIQTWLSQVLGAVVARVENAHRASRGPVAVRTAARCLWRVVGDLELRGDLTGLGMALTQSMVQGDPLAQAAALREIEAWVSRRAGQITLALRRAFD